jgi:molybdopterin biosynthesis enzyme
MVHHFPMIITQRLPPSLTPLDAALAMLLDGLAPVAPSEVPLAEAIGCVAAPMPPLGAFPPHDVAAVDGWALRARDLVGASSYSPLPLAQPPAWVEAGDAMPAGCDCVVDADLVEAAGPLVQVLAEAIPGQGIRRAGEDIAEGDRAIAAGLPIRARDLLKARVTGLKTLAVRRPRLHLINVPAAAGTEVTASFIAGQAEAAGAAVTRSDAAGREAASIAPAFDEKACDLWICVGGTGVGRGDASVEALAMRGEVLAHGIALQPGRTAAIGKIAGIAAIALPGAADQALATWWTLALPALDRLSARQPRSTLRLPLARKIASGVGVAEIALLRQVENTWLPLASGELSFDAIARADAWLAVPAGSEGFAADTPVDAYMMQD